MDGLSAAASGIAVVSLAIQLVDSVGRIRRFLRSVSDAPKELERLVDLLEQLELILGQIQMMVEKQQNADPGNTGLFTNVLRAIKSCEIKLARFESLIEATKHSSFSGKRTAKTTESFKLACKKKDIQDFESQLNEAMNLLNLTLTATLTYVSYTHTESMEQLLTQVTETNQATNTITQEMILIRTDIASDRKVRSNETRAIVSDGPQRRDERNRSKILSNQLTTFQKYASPFGELFVRKTSRSQSFSSEVGQTPPGAYTVDESSWVFMPSFLSSCVNFRHLNTCGTIQRSLRTYPIIPGKHPVWDMCADANVQGIQKLISEGQVSPFSVDKQGKTLLHEAVTFCNPNLCRLLFELGHTGEEVDFHGIPAYTTTFLFKDFSESGVHDFESIYHLFASRIDDLDPGTFDPFFPFSISSVFTDPHLFNKMVNSFVTKRNIDTFATSPIAVGMWGVWQSHPTDRYRNSWKEIIRRLITLAWREDATISSNSRQPTLLGEILDLVNHPLDSVAIGREFLDLLSDLNLDVVAYLHVEPEYYFDHTTSLPMLYGDEYSHRPKRCLVIAEAPPSVSWKWYIDPSGSAFHLLDEFKYLNYANPNAHHFGSEEDLHEVEHEQWPFFFPHWCRFEWRPSQQSIRKKHKDRVQHRQHKKAVKLAKAQGIYHRGPDVPGAWID